MIYIRPGVYVYELLQLLSATGEFPYSSLHILSPSRSLLDLVHKLSQWQDFDVEWSGKRYRARMLSISGKRGSKNLRLHRSALPLLDELHPELLAHYLGAFRGHAFSGKRSDIERNHRVGESIAMMMAAGAMAQPCFLPPLQAERIELTFGDTPCYYPSRLVKRLDGSDSMNKTGFTRMTGLLLRHGLGYAVYNTRGSVMKWHGAGELKAMVQCDELSRRNAGVDALTGAILLGADGSTALNTLRESSKGRAADCRFDRVYRHIHFVPMTGDGKRLLRLLMRPGLPEQLRSLLFPPEHRAYGRTDCDCDAFTEGKYILSHLDGDLARLVRFRLAAYEDRMHRYELVCYPWQLGYAKPYLGERIEPRCIAMDTVERALSD